MSLVTLFLIAVGLSMDAFAVSVCKGLALKKVSFKNTLLVGLWFGGFQALMPLIGYTLGSTFADYIIVIDHWVAFVLLALIGGNMIKEALGGDDDCDCKCEINPFGMKTMFLMAVATSIDALAVGITFAFLRVEILWAITFIGITTFCFSAAGIKIGSIFGSKFKSKAEFAGGFILICLGIKILLEHTLLA